MNVRRPPLFVLRSPCCVLLLLWCSVLLSLPLAAATLSIAHRGDSLYAPENTVAAFKSALPKADLVELDGHVSADGHIIVIHDSTVTRTTDGTGSVAAMTLSQLKALDAGSWFSSAFAGERLPTLEEALTNIHPAAVPLIERKAGSATAYVEELRRLNLVTNVVLQAFDWNFLAAVNALEPAIELCALGSGTFTTAQLTTITNAGARRIAWEKASVNSNMLAQVRAAGLTLFVWTVDGPEIKNFLDLGVDGIISNDPGMVRDFQNLPTNGPVNLQQGLLSYWRMDDGLAAPMATAVSDSRSSNPATLTRGDALSHWFGTEDARFGGALQLDGANAFVTIPRSASLDIGTNEITLSMWVKLAVLPSQLTTSFGALFDSTNDCYVLYLDKGNKELRFKVTDVSNHAARPGIPESALRLNEWLHVVGTYSGQAGATFGRASIYLDGEPRDAHNGNDNTTPVGLTGNIKPGQTAGLGREGAQGGNYFSGLVDDVAIWTRALSASEVLALYNGGKSGLSLGDLIRQPTPLIQPKSVRVISGEQLEVEFQNLWTYTQFRLLRAETLAGPFLPVYNLTPVSLGRGFYQFTYPMPPGGQVYFRIEAQ